MATPYRLKVIPMSSFPAPGGIHFYESGRNYFKCRLDLIGASNPVPQSIRCQIKCNLYSTDGTSCDFLTKGSSNWWNFEIVHGVSSIVNNKDVPSEDVFTTFPTILSFNLKKAIPFNVMIRITVTKVAEGICDPDEIAMVDTTSFSVRSKVPKVKKPTQGPILGLPAAASNVLKRKRSDSTDASSASTCPIKEWVNLAMKTMYDVSSSRDVNESSRTALREVMREYHRLDVEEDVLRLMRDGDDNESIGDEDSSHVNTECAHVLYAADEYQSFADDSSTFIDSAVVDALVQCSGFSDFDNAFFHKPELIRNGINSSGSSCSVITAS